MLRFAVSLSKNIFEGLFVSRGQMTASTIYQAGEDQPGGLLLTGGMSGPKVCIDSNISF